MSKAASNASWESLPICILVQIFDYLSTEDRGNALVTCKSWLEAILDPFLRQTLDVAFCSAELEEEYDDKRPCNHKAVIRACKWGRWAYRLRVTFREPVDQTVETGFPYMRDFFNILILPDMTPQITKLCFRGVWPGDHIDDEKFEEALKPVIVFLRNQKSLNDVALDSKMDLLSGCLFLDAIGCQSSEAVKALNIVGCFADDIRRKPKTAFKYISNFNKLSELYLMYDDLGTDLVLNLAENCKNTLKFLYVEMVCNEGDQPHTISSAVWKQLASTIPKLKVAVSVDSSCMDLDLLKKLLPEGMPVVCLGAWNDAAIPCCINYYASIFPSTLEAAVFFASDENFSKIDEAILSLVVACPKLRTLDVYGNVSVPVAEELLDMKSDNKISLNNLIIKFRNLSKKDEEHMEAVNDFFADLKADGILAFSFSCEALPTCEEEDEYQCL